MTRTLLSVDQALVRHSLFCLNTVSTTRIQQTIILKMAAFHTLPALFLFAIYCSQAHADHCPSIHEGSFFTQSFDCPQDWQSWDWTYCCDEYESDQHCCNSYEYFGAWDTGTIIGATFGGLIGVSLLVTLIIVCCVCVRKRPMPRPPFAVSTVVHRPTVPAPQQYVPEQQYAVHVQQECVSDSRPPPAYNEVVPPKVGEYQQFSNEPDYPVN